MTSTLKLALIKSVAFTFVALIALGSTTYGQETRGIVAILDVAKVFKENQVFKAKMDAIKAEADRLKETITAQQEQIKVRAQGLNELERGTPDRNKLEADLEVQQTSLRTQARQAETELLNREALIYYETYQQMQAVVSQMANEYGLSLVLRFDSEPIDPNNRTEVIKGVNRAVVFHRKLDLTDMVTQQLNQRMAQGGGTALK